MPTLPLFASPDVQLAAGASPDASHGVTAPGGYEWWHFDAEDETGDVRVVAGLFDGFPFHPGYLRAHARYLRNPTRVAPAVPSQYPCASLAAYERGRVVAKFTTQYPPGTFEASDRQPRVRVGANVLEPEGDGTLRLAMGWKGVAARLRFRPLLSPPSPAGERRALAGVLGCGDHFHVMVHPLCEVTGTVRVPGASGAAARVIEFRGHGFHDHRYGSGPITTGVWRWMRGRVLGVDRITVFEFVEPLDRRLPPRADVTDLHARGTRRSLEGGERMAWSGGLSQRAWYPAQVNAGLVALARPRVLDAGPFVTRLIYDAEVVTGEPTGEAFKQSGTALCEAVAPGRLGWPIRGRIAERWIERADGVPSA